jgi:hypothetical protein
VPASQLDLTDGASTDERRSSAYRELLAADNEQQLVGAPQDTTVRSSRH